MRKTRIACCQMDSGFGTKKQNIQNMVRMINKAADQDVGLIILPEVVNTSDKELDKLDETAEDFPNGQLCGM